MRRQDPAADQEVEQMSTAAEAIERELDEKNKVVAHLTQTLAHTRDCLEIARAALESIADDDGMSVPRQEHARCREIALNALGQI
jgi:hypothetical protein